MCRRRARGDFRRCAHSGGCRGGINVVASRPRSAAPAKITPSPPPPGLRVSACIADSAGSGFAKKKTKTGRRRRPPYGCEPTFNVRAGVRRASIRWAPPVPSLPFFVGINYWRKEGSLQARDVLHAGRRARGDSRRCRGARAACPKTDTSLRDRPSEHSVENLPEPDDQSNEPEPTKWILIAQIRNDPPPNVLQRLDGSNGDEMARDESSGNGTKPFEAEQRTRYEGWKHTAREVREDAQHGNGEYSRRVHNCRAIL